MGLNSAGSILFAGIAPGRTVLGGGQYSTVGRRCRACGRSDHTYRFTSSRLPERQRLVALLGAVRLSPRALFLPSPVFVSILFAGVPPGRTVLVAVNTLLSAAGAVLAAAGITRYRFGKPDASLSANGWVCGLVASSAGCAFVPPAAALLIGLVSGALVTFTVAWMEARLGLDDPAGAVSVHAIGGIWGILAVGLFPRAASVAASADIPTTVQGGQMLAQIVGVATLVGFVLPFTYSLNWLLNYFSHQRIPPEEERHGADLYELGAGAYPEFMTHTDEFSQW